MLMNFGAGLCLPSVAAARASPRQSGQAASPELAAARGDRGGA